MEKQFAASEVRRLSNRIPRSNDEIADAQEALRAFADLLEAQEKAKPVATVEDQFGFPVMEWIGDAGEKCPVGTNLYTHSTQAQPPAASVTDAMQELADKYHELLWAVARKFPGETRHETALRYIREAECQEAALAAQESPNG